MGRGGRKFNEISDPLKAAHTAKFADLGMSPSMLQHTPPEHVRLLPAFIGTPTIVPEFLSRDKDPQLPISNQGFASCSQEFHGLDSFLHEDRAEQMI
jgi:hypothetical protein